MDACNICTDYIAIIAGTDQKYSRPYTEAKKIVEANGDAGMAKLKKFITSIEEIASKGAVKDSRISASRGNIKEFSGHENIKTAMSFIKQHLGGVEPLRDLNSIYNFLSANANLYSQGYSKNVRIIQLEYESAVYMVVTGLAMIMSTSLDVVSNGTSVAFKKKPGATRGTISQTARNLAKEMNSKSHKDYLEALIAGKEMGHVSDSDVHTEATMYFTEAGIFDTIELLHKVIGNIHSIGKFAKRTFTGVKQSVFGILPLIRGIMYLRYKKKADTIAALEQQCVFIQRNIEQLKNIKDMDPQKKATIIKKQQAYIEAYKKKAEKLRAELMEGEREASSDSKKGDATISSNKGDEDFVLEQAGINPDFFRKG